MARPEDILGFQDRDKLLAVVRDAFSRRSSPAVPVVAGGVGTIPVGLALPIEVVAFLEGNRRALVAVRRVVRNAGKRGIRLIRKRVRSLDLRDTRLFISAWRASIVDVSGVGLRIDLSFQNAAPYAKYVHPKRTARDKTFVNINLPPILDKVAKQIAEDLAPLLSRFGTTVNRAASGMRTGNQAIRRAEEANRSRDKANQPDVAALAAQALRLLRGS